MAYEVLQRYYETLAAGDPNVIGLAQALRECSEAFIDRSALGDLYGDEPAPLYIDQALTLLSDDDARARVAAFLTGKKPGAEG